jgi:hypothetical protein
VAFNQGVFSGRKIIPDYAVAEFAEDARQEGAQTYFGTSSARQQSKFGEIGNPLRLQIPKKYIKISFTFWVKDLNTFVTYNRPILKINFLFRHLKCIIWDNTPDQ